VIWTSLVERRSERATSGTNTIEIQSTSEVGLDLLDWEVVSVRDAFFPGVVVYRDRFRAVRDVESSDVHEERAVDVDASAILIEGSVFTAVSSLQEFEQSDIAQGIRLGGGTYGDVFKCTGRSPGPFAGQDLALKKPAIGKKEDYFNEMSHMLKFSDHENHVALQAAHFVSDDNSSVDMLLIALYDCSLKDVLKARYEWTRNQGAWFAPDEVRTWLKQIASALAFMHDSQIAHLEYVLALVVIRLFSTGSNFSLQYKIRKRALPDIFNPGGSTTEGCTR
jgi:Protein kinase domain